MKLFRRNDEYFKEIQVAVKRLEPGQVVQVSRDMFDWSYRKIESTEDLIFGPQVSPKEYFEELNPDYRATLPWSIPFVVRVERGHRLTRMVAVRTVTDFSPPSICDVGPNDTWEYEVKYVEEEFGDLVFHYS